AIVRSFGTLPSSAVRGKDAPRHSVRRVESVSAELPDAAKRADAPALSGCDNARLRPDPYDADAAVSTECPRHAHKIVPRVVHETSFGKEYRVDPVAVESRRGDDIRPPRGDDIRPPDGPVPRLFGTGVAPRPALVTR